jgi:hypothetical protein
MAATPAAALISTIKMDSEGKFADAQIEEFKVNPLKYQMFVKAVEQIVNSRFPMVCSYNLFPPD